VRTPARADDSEGSSVEAVTEAAPPSATRPTTSASSASEALTSLVSARDCGDCADRVGACHVTHCLVRALVRAQPRNNLQAVPCNAAISRPQCAAAITPLSACLTGSIEQGGTVTESFHIPTTCESMQPRPVGPSPARLAQPCHTCMGSLQVRLGPRIHEGWPHACTGCQADEADEAEPGTDAITSGAGSLVAVACSGCGRSVQPYKLLTFPCAIAAEINLDSCPNIHQTPVLNERSEMRIHRQRMMVKHGRLRGPDALTRCDEGIPVRAAVSAIAAITCEHRAKAALGVA